MKNSDRWTAEKARDWYDRQPWPCGFNYIPACAISYTEMWMDYCFDPEFIRREMALAREVGFNCIRVVLPFVVWENEPEAFKRRLEQFLETCDEAGLRVIPSLFDDCTFGPITDPVFGSQPEVIPGWYGNGWTPSPGHGLVRDASTWPRLERYVRDVIGSFRNDPRVWVWDLYNEPTNGVVSGKETAPLGNASIPLAEEVFRWAREIDPPQPLTLGEWNDNAKLNALARGSSDIITFHNYDRPEALEKRIRDLKTLGRPTICTEWFNRATGSTAADCLPVFQRENVGALHWGLVNGKTQTHLNWKHLPGEPDPPVWQCDLFRSDHTAYDPDELRTFRQTIARAAQSTFRR